MMIIRNNRMIIIINNIQHTLETENNTIITKHQLLEVEFNSTKWLDNILILRMDLVRMSNNKQ